MKILRPLLGSKTSGLYPQGSRRVRLRDLHRMKDRFLSLTCRKGTALVNRRTVPLSGVTGVSALRGSRGSLNPTDLRTGGRGPTDGRGTELNIPSCSHRSPSRPLSVLGPPTENPTVVSLVVLTPCPEVPTEQGHYLVPFSRQVRPVSSTHRVLQYFGVRR